VTSDCNGLYCKLDPREGARIAVAEAARNLACSGATPLAITDNLNFGNPYRAEIFWQLREAVEGLSEACKKFNIPVIGGNVSLYNQNPTGAIDPTPTVGMVGIIAQEGWITRQYFRSEGDIILLLVPLGGEMGATHYLKVVHGWKEGLPPRLNFDLELGVQKVLLSLIQSGFLRSAHDCSEGGLGVALAECCISGESMVGASVRLGSESSRMDLLLFNESQSRVIISVGQENLAAVEELCAAAEVPLARLGVVGGLDLVVTNGRETVKWKTTELCATWYYSIEHAMLTR
jgi:phosphoribosylformylglycinamidine synthase subunit PurL